MGGFLLIPVAAAIFGFMLLGPPREGWSQHRTAGRLAIVGGVTAFVIAVIDLAT